MKKLALLIATSLLLVVSAAAAQRTGNLATHSPGVVASRAAYIKFEGIPGEAKDRGHNEWSELASFSQVIRHPGQQAGATRRRGDVVLEDIVVVKELDKSSPKLAEAICKGTVFPKVEIHLTSGNSATYYAYELKNVQVVSYSVSGSGASGEAPVEEISLNFEEVKVTYTESDGRGAAKGNIEYTWKVEEGRS